MLARRNDAYIFLVGSCRAQARGCRRPIYDDRYIDQLMDSFRTYDARIIFSSRPLKGYK